MAEARDIGSAQASDMTGAVADVTVPTAILDSPGIQPETYHYNTDWSKWYGYFLNISRLHTAFTMKTIWTLGRGWVADPRTTVILDHISGDGKQTARGIFCNQDMVKNVNGDSYAEIIWDDAELFPLNLKPLNPANMAEVYGPKGNLIRYEQINTGKTIKFRPKDIFHLTNCRIGDQTHGISRIAPMEPGILAINEGFVDTKKVMHFQGRPYILWKLKTDDPVKIAAFVAKIDAARNLGEDMFIPDDEDIVKHEVVDINPSPFILEWQRELNNDFYRGLGMPLVLFGQAGQNESGSKIEFTGHTQVWGNDQLYFEEAVWQQLHLRIKLVTPPTLLDNLKTDEAKDANQGQEFQPNDVTAGTGR